MPIIDVVMPAYNEAKSIALVLNDIPRALVRHIVVCDNNSTDGTGAVAQTHGAIVVFQPERGYGNACLKALDWIHQQKVLPDIVVFLDSDYSDHPEEMFQLVEPLIINPFDMVIGSRALGNRERGAMQPQQIFGNWLATTLIRWFYGYHFTDLGPFRAITYAALQKIGMKDKNFGWTVEMQVKAAKLGLRCTEVAVQYRRRVGISKISGTVKGTILAGYKILWTIFKYIFSK
jgi:glycosyltransferase involved in cell wall biosynthesis